MKTPDKKLTHDKGGNEKEFPSTGKLCIFFITCVFNSNSRISPGKKKNNKLTIRSKMKGISENRQIINPLWSWNICERFRS